MTNRAQQIGETRENSAAINETIKRKTLDVAFIRFSSGL